MEVWKPGERKRNSVPFTIIYGPTGVGKTGSCLASLPEPQLHISAERRDPEITLMGVEDYHKRKIDVTFASPSDVDEIPIYLNEKLNELDAGELPFKSITFDGASYTMEVLMRIKAENETFDAGTFKQKIKTGGAEQYKFKRPFVDESRLDEATWGAFASKMYRISELMGMFATKGVVAVMVALIDKDVRWDKTGSFEAAPLFGGKKFPANVPGFMDLIGLVQDSGQRDDKGRTMYPPLVSFRSDDKSFVAKWTGPYINPVDKPLDFGKILKIFQRKEGK